MHLCDIHNRLYKGSGHVINGMFQHQSVHIEHYDGLCRVGMTAYLLSVDDCRHVIISFIEQCLYSLVNIVVDKDNTFLRTLNQVGHESIGIINLPIVEHTTGD